MLSGSIASVRRGFVAARARSLLYQALLIVGLVGLALLIYHTTSNNLKLLGVNSGFAFLEHRSGFAIAQTLIPYDEDSSIARAFFVAALNTLLLAGTASVVATLLGLAVGTLRMSSNWLVSKLAQAYVEIFRNVPALLQIFFWYFVALRSLPSLAQSVHIPLGFILNNRGLYFPTLQLHGAGWIAGAALVGVAVAGCAHTLLARRRIAARFRGVLVALIWLATTALPLFLPSVGFELVSPTRGRFEYESQIVLMPEYLALLIGLSMYQATYIAEIVRSSFTALPTGQAEAANALGLSPFVRFQRVMLPQALIMMLPPLASVYVNLLKATSLGAAIAYPEIVSVFVGTVNNLVGQPVEIMGLTLVVYVALAFAVAAAMNAYNRRLRRRGQQ
jgi:general L-amino acid transport system permease protein